MTHTKSPVIQQQDYYPFGLTFNSYQRENSTSNQYLYNSKETQDELSLGWIDYGARMYMPEIGRWGVIDLLCERTARLSPYVYAYNNPMRFTDPTGMANEDEVDRKTYEKDGKYHTDIFYGSDEEGSGGGGGGIASVDLGGCCGRNGGNAEIKRDATGGSNESVKAAQIKYGIDKKVNQLAIRDKIKRLMNFAKAVDWADLAYKTKNTNFQGQNFRMGRALERGGTLKDVVELVIAISDQDFSEMAEAAASLGFELLKYGDGYAVIELGFDAIKLIGEASMPEYAMQLKASANANFSEAMKFGEGHPLRVRYLNRAIAEENEAIKIATETLK